VRTADLPALWGGIECTVNRVGDVVHDQLERSGHAGRPEDLDRVAALGIRTLRYPVLWERTAPDAGEPRWAWPDERLGRLRRLGIRPIVGLVHHGSGPRYTSLLDPGFATGLADYAGAAAERYPWVEEWTPVNEPLTTARFAALYGHWHPHARDTRSFLRAVVVQCRATVLAMRAIRRVVPRARLVQTEDLGTIHATPAIAYQADYENHRRWLSLDLLHGHVDQRHPLWRHLREHGVGEAELAFFREQPCAPDVTGLNYYLTSDRLLDERWHRHPPASHGGNGRVRYADVAAVRAWAPGITGHRAVLETAWRRYARPVALTEVHLGCTRDEQLRWLVEAWQGARAARAAGADVRAVTVWSLLGAHDWNSLVVRADGFYEPGVFDVRGPEPRPTALAGLVRALAAGTRYDHPVLDGPGWWRRPERLTAEATWPPPDGAGREPHTADPRPVRRDAARTIVVTGATGTLGRAFARICDARGLAYRLTTRADMDIADEASVARALGSHRPWAVVNTAGYVRVDDAEHDHARCHRENARGPTVLAAACAERGIRLVTFSSDLVFDGTRGTPYLESHPVGPLCVYGQTKAEAERQVASRSPDALVIRTGAFFGPWDVHNFVTIALAALAAGRPFRAAADTVVSPTYVPDLVHACLDLLIDGERGIWHVANHGAVTWADFARLAARTAGCDQAAVEACTARDLGLIASRPAYSALASERAPLLGDLEASLWRYVRERETRPASC
jgi:dTDP-4-dehydrorhamnose reductase